MSLAWPYALLGLLAVPALAAAYAWDLRRRRRQAVLYSSVALVRAAAPSRARWRRHVPIALVLASLAALSVASARPQVSATVPVARSSMLLALDVSGSMCSTDVEPNRLAAAQEAVRTFVKNQDDKTKIGLVVFAGYAQLAVPPTTEKDALIRAIDTLATARGTAIGAAILKSIDAIAEINPDVAPASPEDSAGGADPGDGTAPGPPSTPAPPGTPAPQRADGDYAPDIVVLLTDGANTRGIKPVDAAQQAAERGVRVYTIGFGTTNPTEMVCTAAQLGSGQFDGPGRRFPGGPGGFGNRNFLVADEPTLREVAETTGAAYFAARDADQLNEVLADLPRQVEVQRQDVEASVGFAVLGGLLILLALGLSVRWGTFP